MTPVIFYRAYEFDIDSQELDVMRNNFPCYHNRVAIPVGSLVVGRYSVVPFYREVAEDIELSGSQLINSYAQHRYVADLRNWYGDLEGLTPKTWFNTADLPMDHPGSFVLKGATNSKKFMWNTHMFAADRSKIGEVLIRLQTDSLVGSQDIYIRQYIPLHTYTIGFHDLPITEEYRVFVLDGQILCGAYYWSSHIDEIREMGHRPDFSNVPQDFMAEIIRRVGDRVRFWVVDVARTAEEEWIVVELNDGQMSGLSENSPDDLYSALKLRLNGEMLKFANIPDAPRLTDEDLKRLAEDGQRFAKIVEEDTAKMERITGDDLTAAIGANRDR